MAPLAGSLRQGPWGGVHHVVHSRHDDWPGGRHRQGVRPLRSDLFGRRGADLCGWLQRERRLLVRGMRLQDGRRGCELLLLKHRYSTTGLPHHLVVSKRTKIGVEEASNRRPLA